MSWESGLDRDSKKVQCDNCSGSGWVIPDKPSMDEIDKMLERMFSHENLHKICPICHGRGLV